MLKLGNLRPLCSVSSAALIIGSMALATPALAQQTATSASAPAGQDGVSSETGQEIVVTGFRASLRNAINEKRNSDEQIDAITAEDIADFPDSNLAESLQRLPGVSIDRDNGEGRGISVRGLGGDFNRTRLNGLEALSTAGSNDAGTAANRSRSFDYNTFASELFSSLTVRKTASAQTDEGSLGATIDLVTGRPFDYKKGALALGVEGNYEKNAKKWSPRLSGLVSRTFFDGDIGFLVSAAYSESHKEIDQYRRGIGSSDYLYRGADYAGNETPQRAGFAAPTGTNLGTAVTNPDAIAALTGSNATAYANLYPGAPYNTPGRFDDSLVRIPALPSVEQQNNDYDRLGITAAYQWRIAPKTVLSLDGLYSRFHNKSVYNQIGPVGLNRNNTDATFNTATNTLTPTAARNLYPSAARCTPQVETDIQLPQDCGLSLYGTTPAFATAVDQNNNRVASVLGNAAITPGATSAANANIFSTNPFNLDVYDYYNNPNSVGYIPSSNHLAFRGSLIGRPAVKVLESHVTNGLADYLVLQNVDFRSAQDGSEYTTKFMQGSANLKHEFSDSVRMEATYGQSRSENSQQGLLVEFNRMDSQGLFVYDERDRGEMPKFDFGFDAANAANWDTIKGFSAIRNYVRNTRNSYDGGKVDFEWDVNDEFGIKAGFTHRKFEFRTDQYERNSDVLNPTLREAGTNSAAVAKTIQFGQGLNIPQGTVTSFVVPDTQKFLDLYDFDCNCINKWSDWRITRKRNRTATFGVTEKNTGGYLQFDFDTMMFGGRLRGNAGTRIMVTDVFSFGETSAGRPITGDNKYTDYLPSMNLAYEPLDDVIVRFGASKVMSRPLLGNLSPSISAISFPSTVVPATGAVTGATLTIGNPKLKPFRATNMDLSAEWYFAPGALLSVAAFSKEIDSFPQTVFIEGNAAAFFDAETLAALRLQFPAGTAAGSYLANPDAIYGARQFADAPGGYLRGIEANFQMDLTFLPGFLKHLGVQVNGTYIKSELNYILEPGTATTPRITGKGPFLGVSPKALNATVYYETKRFSLRASGAYRAGFSRTYPLASGTCSPGISFPAGTVVTPNTAPTYCSAPLINDFEYSKSTFNLDLSTSVQVTDFLTITGEALNLTNQTTNRYAYTGQEAVSNYASTGAIYRVGARVRF